MRCYNEEQHIGRLLDGIVQQTREDVEIIVVDSGSTDATRTIASKYPVKLLSIKPEDFSFGRSLNLGCRAATGDFIVIASAHVYPTYQDWLEKLVAPFSDPDVALVYGKQRGNENTKFSEQQVLLKWFPDTSTPSQEHPFCNNANSAVRRSVFEHLEYDETLTGLEDTDWATKAMALGHKISYVAEAEIVHVHNETMKQTYNRYRREAIALKRIAPDERFSLRDFCRLFAANVISDYRQAWRDRVLGKSFLGILSFRFLQFWGTYRGFGRSGPVTSQLKRAFYYPKHQEVTPPSDDRTEHQPRINYVDDSADQPGKFNS